MLRFRLFPGSIQKKLAVGWLNSFPYTDISGFLWLLNGAVNDFVNVTTACAQLHNRLLRFDLDTILVASAPVQNEI